MKPRPTRFEPEGFFMLRRPLLALETLYDFNDRTSGSPELFEQELFTLFSRPPLTEAVYLASPALHRALSAWISGNPARVEQGVLQSLYKYLVRVCSRATPFGLFSGFATGVFSETTQIHFGRADQVERYTHLEMTVASELGSSLLTRSGVLQQLPLFVNSSLYPMGDQYRYVERTVGPQGQSHNLSAVKRDQLLERVIGLCQNGCSFKILAAHLGGQMSSEQVTGYIQGLVQMQILVSGLEVNVTGRPYIELVQQHLNAIGRTTQQVKLLKKIRRLLLAPGPLETAVGRLSGLLEEENITTQVEMPVAVDLRLGTLQCTISQKWIVQLSKEFEQISMLFEFSQPDSDLERFKRAFIHRYEGQQIPLLEALDAESGIGYGAIVPGVSDQLPLLDDLRFPPRQPAEVSPATALTNFKEQLLRRALTEGLCSIELSARDLEPMKESRGHPGHFYWLGSILSASAAQFDQGNFRFLLRAVGGSSGLELLGRFCHADPVLSELVQACACRQQSQADAVLAEIAHLPAASVAGVLTRPHLTDYEIVYLAGSARPVEKRILASDLMVSVRNGEQLILWSRQLNKQVVPVLNSAHNFSAGLPVYRFLCELAGEHQTYGSWDWGLLGARAFLPRLTYKHLVLSRATWNLTRQDFPHLPVSTKEFVALWELVRKRLQIPRYFQICRHDQELLVDSENSFSIDLLKDTIYKTGKARIVEVLQEPGEGLIVGDQGHYAHEILIPFRPVTADQFPPANIRLPQPEQRQFMAASSWLFVKIYSGTSTAERILTDLIRPYCREMLGEGKLQKWFFIRYQDPDHHLRLRFYNECQTDFWQYILNDLQRLCSGWVESRLIQRVQIDTYSRELERYQGLDYRQVEFIFYADSQAVVELIEHLGGHCQPDDQRWLAALLGADVLMDDLGLSLDEKLELVSGLDSRLLGELAAGADLKIQLDRQYRSHKGMITAYMNRCPSGVGRIFSERSMAIRQVFESEPAGSRFTVQVVASFVHMFFNRIFTSAARQQELVMYHYLNKYYKTLTECLKNKCIA